MNIRLPSYLLIALLSALRLSAQNTFPSSGSVGVGTTSPRTALDIVGTTSQTSGNGANQFYQSSGNEFWRFYPAYADGSFYLTRGAQNPAGSALDLFRFQGDGTLAILNGGLNTTGSVGIGTSTPDAQLKIETSVSDAMLHINANTGGGGVPLIRLQKQGANKWGWLGEYPVAGTTSFYSYALGDIVLALRSSGNVGIGTTNPQSKLQVGGWNFLKDGTWAPPVTPGTDSAGERIVFYQGGGWKTAIGMDGQNGIWFQAHTPTGQVGYQWFTGANASAPSEKMRIMENGNVGIGTTNPTQKLSVNGTIRAKEVIVDTGWSDYVFASDYTLAPLSEVEAHIKAHHTLPGVPSEAQVAEYGISVGEMQAKLLAKIEELTLHVIEQQKQIDALKATLTPNHQTAHP